MVDRLRSIPGIGLLTATALLAAVADIQRFQPGRHFASYLGLTRATLQLERTRGT